MQPRRNGRIINVSSIAAFRGGLDGVAYTASKAGILGLTRRAAFDVGRHGITVNAICPGAFATDIRQNSAEILGWRQRSMDDKGVGVTMPPEMFEYQVPIGRRGHGSEVAAVAVFLASDQAAYVNGESIAVDGGWTAI